VCCYSFICWSFVTFYYNGC